MVTALVFCDKEMTKNSKKMMEIVNIEEEIFISSERVEKFQYFQEKCSLIKSHKKQCFTRSLENIFLEKTTGGGVILTPQPF